MIPIRAGRLRRKRKREELTPLAYVGAMVLKRDSGYDANQRLVAMAIAGAMSPVGKDWVSFPSLLDLQGRTGLGRSTISAALQVLRKHPLPLFQMKRPPQGQKLFTKGIRHATYRYTLIRHAQKFAEARDRHAKELEEWGLGVLPKMIERMVKACGATGDAGSERESANARQVLEDAMKARCEFIPLVESFKASGFKTWQITAPSGKTFIWPIPKKVPCILKDETDEDQALWRRNRPMIADQMTQATGLPIEKAHAFLDETSAAGVSPQKLFDSLTAYRFRNAEVTSPKGQSFYWPPILDSLTPQTATLEDHANG